MGRRPKTTFEESLIKNNANYNMYLDRLRELSLAMFEYKNLPKTVNERYIELNLFSGGRAVYFHDSDLLKWKGEDTPNGIDLCLSCSTRGQFDVYGDPTIRRAYSRYSPYNRELDETNSVIIWNNYLHTNSERDIKIYAIRLWNLDRIIDINANAQKTPVLIKGTEQQMLTLKNVYMKYDGNEPVLFADKNLDLNGFGVLSTNAPYVADKIYELKTQIWNEALTYLGISNINIQKKERLITDEVTRDQGGVIASRYSRLETRRACFEKVNDMFGTDIEVNYREDFQSLDLELPDNLGLNTVRGDENE